MARKTPRHLQYADLLAAQDSSIRFIHIIRRGEDVMPSLYFATQQHPEECDGARSLKKCVFWWNRSVRLSKKYWGNSDYKFISYDEVTAESAFVMQEICAFLSLEYEPAMLERFNQTAESLIKDSEEWKKNRSSEIDASSKLSQLSNEQQAYVKNHIVDFPFDRIRV